MDMRVQNIRRFLKNFAKNILKMTTSKVITERSKGKSIRFFRKLVDDLKDSITRPIDIFMRDKSSGYFYLFVYRSKLYDEGKLEWFDMYPLILVLSTDRKGFYGINFHYMSPRQQQMVLKKLILKYNYQFMEDKRLYPMNWKIFKTMMSNRKYIKNPIKRYLWKQLKRIRGLRVARISNTDVIEAVKYTSPMWLGTSYSEVLKWIKKNS